MKIAFVRTKRAVVVCHWDSYISGPRGGPYVDTAADKSFVFHLFCHHFVWEETSALGVTCVLFPRTTGLQRELKWKGRAVS